MEILADSDVKEGKIKINSISKSFPFQFDMLIILFLSLYVLSGVFHLSNL